jgi:2-polyprenyl-6-hydroxyphenyl methylase/3-demethylubiquinone-9 3-methyltransferase
MNPALLLSPFLIQGALMVLDEFYYHEKRGLGLWERMGHPLDTLTVLGTLVYLAMSPAGTEPSLTYISLAAFSCLFVTKDEWVHTREAPAGENALHALLFMLHPVIFFSAYFLRQSPQGQSLLVGQTAVIAAFGLYQLFRWKPWQWARSQYAAPSNSNAIETQVYSDLGERWYTAKDDPIALLRAESKTRLPWITQTLEKEFPRGEQKQLLDLGCGAGLLTNALAAQLPKQEWELHGLDSSEGALKTAQNHQPSPQNACAIHYRVGDAYALPYAAQSFDAVCAMDFLEHVQDKDQVLHEVARVLKPGGVFFYHTFTATALSRLLVIDIVEAFVPNTPKGLHIDSLFITPSALHEKLRAASFAPGPVFALNPKITLNSLTHLITKREIPDSFSFRIEPSKKISAGYIGFAKREVILPA